MRALWRLQKSQGFVKSGIGAAAFLAAAMAAGPAAAYDCGVLSGLAEKYQEVCQVFDAACDDQNRADSCRVLANAEGLMEENQVVYWMMMHAVTQSACPPGRRVCDLPESYQLMAQ